MRIISILSFIGLIGLASSIQANSADPGASPPDSIVDPAWIIKKNVISRATILSGTFTSPELVLKIYEASSFRPIWSIRIQDSAWFSDLIMALENLRYDALPLWRYNAMQIDYLYRHSGHPHLLDVYITDAILTSISDMLTPVRQAATAPDAAPSVVPQDSILMHFEKIQYGFPLAALLPRLRPQTETYHRLRASYQRKFGKSISILLPRNIYLQTGDRGTRVKQLVDRLEAEGLLREEYFDYYPYVFDRTLESAVKTYQKANGLKVDGIVGPKTRASLNRLAHDISNIIAMNLQQERERYLVRQSDN